MYYQLPHKCTYKLQIIKSSHGLVDKTRNYEHKQLLDSQLNASVKLIYVL